MNRAARELVKKAEALGFRLRTDLTGSGHLTLEHPNGSYTCASTPSEYRSTKNALADLERIAGQKLERPNHRRSRKNPNASSDPELEAARRRHRREWDAKADERDAERQRELARQAAAKRAADDDRRRREIERLMR